MLGGKAKGNKLAFLMANEATFSALVEKKKGNVESKAMRCFPPRKRKQNNHWWCTLITRNKRNEMKTNIATIFHVSFRVERFAHSPCPSLHASGEHFSYSRSRMGWRMKYVKTKHRNKVPPGRHSRSSPRFLLESFPSRKQASLPERLVSRA